jgi:hypothetical protein
MGIRSEEMSETIPMYLVPKPFEQIRPLTGSEHATEVGKQAETKKRITLKIIRGEDEGRSEEAGRPRRPLKRNLMVAANGEPTLEIVPVPFPPALLKFCHRCDGTGAVPAVV